MSAVSPCGQIRQLRREWPAGARGLCRLATPGAGLALRVTPNARRAGQKVSEGVIRISVTVIPEDGRATEAARAALAKALGVAKTQLSLIRGAKSRDRVFRLESPG